MLGYGLYNKLQNCRDILLTKMLAKKFGSFGKKTFINYPIRLSNPERIYLGEKVAIASNVFLTCIVGEYNGAKSENFNGEIHIGDHCLIETGVQISAISKLIIGHGVGFARNCIVSDHTHRHPDPLDPKPRYQTSLTDSKPVVIEDFAFIGAYSLITPGVTVGKGATVGFGSVVTKNVPPYSVVMGNPAKMISRYDFEQNKWVICRRKL